MNTKNHATTLASVAALAALTLGGCEKLTPAGTPGTMNLLRAGSEKVCVADDVQRSLRAMIMPKFPNADASSSDDIRAAEQNVSLGFDLTTLQAFDKAVSKASCNTTLKVAGPDDQPSTFDVNYEVTPAADNPNTFIITANNRDATTFIQNTIIAALNKAISARQVAEREAQGQQERAKLLAVLTPKWFAGKWIATTADASNCADDRALWIAANHMFASQGHSGRWALNGDQLHFVGNGPSGSVDDTSTITAADAVSFSQTSSDGTSSTWRRCARSEMTGPTIEEPLVSNALREESK